jgi:hypothetical protein
MNNEQAIKHLLEVKGRAEKQIKLSIEKSYAINVKQSYDDIESINFVISALKANEKAIAYCKEVLSFGTNSIADEFVDVACDHVLKILEGKDNDV